MSELQDPSGWMTGAKQILSFVKTSVFPGRPLPAKSARHRSRWTFGFAASGWRDSRIFVTTVRGKLIAVPNQRRRIWVS